MLVGLKYSFMRHAVELPRKLTAIPWLENHIMLQSPRPSSTPITYARRRPSGVAVPSEGVQRRSRPFSTKKLLIPLPS